MFTSEQRVSNVVIKEWERVTRNKERALEHALLCDIEMKKAGSPFYLVDEILYSGDLEAEKRVEQMLAQRLLFGTGIVTIVENINGVAVIRRLKSKELISKFALTIMLAFVLGASIGITVVHLAT